MYILITDTHDYSNLKFITHEGPALEEFAQEKEDAIKESSSGYCRGVILLKQNGDGIFQMGMGYNAWEGVEIIDKWEMTV